MFDITNLIPEHKALFDQLVVAERKFLKAQDDFISDDAVSAMEEIEKLVSRTAALTGGDEEEIHNAAEKIAEGDRWNDIVDETMDGIPGDTVMDDGGTADDLRKEMKDFPW